jgi:protein tyrosine/serine phosphatase
VSKSEPDLIFPGLQPASLWNLAGVILIFMMFAGLKECRHHVFLDNFGTVVKGEVYRSGQLTAPQLERVIKRYGLRTVINTREEHARVDAEAATCRAHDVRMVRIAMPGDGRGEYAQYEEALRVLEDPNARPVLVHCARGTHRTGAVIAGYRVHVQGWEKEKALREMKRYRFDPREHPLIQHLEPFLEDDSVFANWKQLNGIEYDTSE